MLPEGTIEKSCRRARVGKNALYPDHSDKPYACFMHTFYMGRWYYDGYNHYASEQEAIEFRDRWLNGAPA